MAVPSRRHVIRSPAAPALADAAQALLAGRGTRATRARIDVLSLLLAAREALSHHEIERRLARGHDIDRVTLYRVLDWLTEQGLAHKLASGDRIRRFSVTAPGHAGAAAHAHFQCNDCGKVICLDDARMPTVSLPRGFRRRGIEVTVKGSCAACAR